VACERLTALREHLRALRPDDWKRFKPGIDGLLRSHRQRLPRERQRFREWWGRWQESGTEAAFLGLLKAPEPATS
jgi:hypothetical protein